MAFEDETRRQGPGKCIETWVQSHGYTKQWSWYLGNAWVSGSPTQFTFLPLSSQTACCGEGPGRDSADKVGGRPHAGHCFDSLACGTVYCLTGHFSSVSQQMQINNLNFLF